MPPANAAAYGLLRSNVNGSLPMFAHTDNYTRWRAVWVCLLSVVSTLSGCWQEVEYIESEPAATSQPFPATEADSTPGGGLRADSPAASPPANVQEGASGQEFADDLAASIAAEPPTVVADHDDMPPAVPGVSPAGAQPAKGDNFDLFGDSAANSTTSMGNVPPTEPPAGERDTVATTGTETTAPPDEMAVAVPVSDIATSAANDPLFGEAATSNQPLGGEITPPVNSATTEPGEAATPVAETVPPTTTGDRPRANKVRLAAWLLGSKLSLASLAHGRGASGDDVQKLMDQSRSLARFFGIQISDIPARPLGGYADGAASDKSLGYLLEQSQMIGSELAERHGAEYAALFEMAVKSNLLLVLYQPDAPTVEAIADAISQAGSRANLTAELAKPLLNVLERQASPADVRTAVDRFHKEVDLYLSGLPKVD